MADVRSDYPTAPWLSPPPAPPATPARPRNRALVLAAVFAGTLVAGGAIGFAAGLLTRSNVSTPPRTGSPNANSAATQARALYRQALAATRASAGVHYVAVSSDGTVTQKIVGDATQDGGGQLITLNSTFGNEQFTLVLVRNGGAVYFQGNLPALEDQLGVPAAKAPSVQGRWVSVASGDGPYGVIAPGITVADQAQSMTLVPTSTTQITAADGSKATRIIGTVSSQQGARGGTAHLDIAAGSNLPISEVSTLSNGATDTATFSNWGTAKPTTAPAGAVAWTSLGASAPPGGYGGGGGSSNGQTPSATPGL
ncbi:MAG TPA: hypothetical protein VIG86_00140 [Candidatus Dormibacteraeota bacterium]